MRLQTRRAGARPPRAPEARARAWRTVGAGLALLAGLLVAAPRLVAAAPGSSPPTGRFAPPTPTPGSGWKRTAPRPGKPGPVGHESFAGPRKPPTVEPSAQFKTSGPETRQMSIGRWIFLYGVLVLLLGMGWRWWSLRGEPPSPARRSAPWRRADLAALALLIGAAAAQVLLVWTLPISEGEASRLEQQFWQTWFFSSTRGAHPPCCRVIMHLGSEVSSAVMALRGLKTAMWLFGFGALYLLLRRRSSPRAAVLLAGLWLVSATIVDSDVQRCKYALWLPLLLLAHDAFERALDGAPRRWLAYTAWMWLACLTHYFTVAYALGHLVFVARRRRDALGAVLTALVTVALSLLPLAWPVLRGAVDGKPTMTPGAGVGQWLPGLAGMALSPGVLPVVLLWWAWRPRAASSSEETPGAARHSGDGAVPGMLLAGMLLPPLTVATLRISARLYLPLLPLCLLWLSRRQMGRVSTWSRRQKWLTATAALLIVLWGLLTGVAHWQRRQSSLWQRYARQTGFSDAEASRDRLLLLYPDSRLRPVLWEISGRTDRAAAPPGGERSGEAITVGRTRVVTLPAKPETRLLERALTLAPRFDLLWFRGGPYSDLARLPEVRAWLDRHCRILVRATVWGEAFGVAYRCRR